MDKKQKLYIIENFLKNKFDIENFKEFTARIINTSVRNRKISDKIWKEYKEYIENYQVIGSYSDDFGNNIEIIAVKTREDKDPVRARSKQRNYIAKYLDQYSKDGALVAFYNERSSQWRLSFIKQELSFNFEGIKKELTPAKRYSYTLGKNEPSYTPINQFKLFLDNESALNIENFEEIFKLEKVTKEFFDEYKEKYLILKGHLEKTPNFIDISKEIGDSIEKASEAFAKKLMGQLSFLYFLQKKGWLGVKAIPQKINLDELKNIADNLENEEKNIIKSVYIRKETYYRLSEEKLAKLSDSECNKLAISFRGTEHFKAFGTGEVKFIRFLFDDHLRRKKKEGYRKNFFKDYLEVLFYGALNKDRGNTQYFKFFNCRIPFLNGGLFEHEYKWEEADFEIPDEIFSNGKDGILDIFDRYNFTISENEPLETEVAVDPEMLGKVFENLLDVKDRKSKGSFYTPREIVHYMCKESLLNYLGNELKEVEKKDIEDFINLGDFTKDYDLRMFDNYKHKKDLNPDWGMPRSVFKNFKQVDEAISNVKVADPAIGSGAFPLGMLIEIVKLRNILTEYYIIDEWLNLEKENRLADQWEMEESIRNKRDLYNLKLETIERSLYGVDIEPSAVDIAKLRMWLSIVVDAPKEDAKPLPNLDFNFMVGNSLLDEFEGIKLFDEKLLKKTLKETYTESKPKLFKMQTGFQKDLFGGLETLKADILSEVDKKHKQFFKEKNTEIKKKLKQEIEDLEWTLIQETLKGSNNEIKLKELKELQKQKRKPYFLWKLEFAEVFQQKGGFDIVIGNPPYVRYEKFKEIREELQKKYICYDTSADLYIYFYELGTNILKENGNLNFITSNKWMKTKYGKNFRNFLLDQNKIYLLIDLGSGVFETASVDSNILCYNKIKCLNYNFFMGNSIKSKYLFNVKNMDKQSFVVMSKEEYLIKSKIENKSKRIKELNFKIRRGILTGCNEAFLIGRDDKKIFEDSKSESLLKPVLRGKDLQKYSIKYDDLYLLATKNGLDIKKNYPEAFNYLEEKNKELSGKIEKRYDKGSHWSNLRNCAYYDEFLENKIIYPEFSSESSFVWEEGKFFNLDTTWYISGAELNKGHLAIFNSSLIWFYLKLISVQLGKSALRMKKIYIEQIPLKEVSDELDYQLTNRVNQIIILKNEGKDTSDLELEIDEMVYDLYELTEEEKEVVRNFKND